MSSSAATSTWHVFKRLMAYAKPFKTGFIIAILGMLGYAAIDSYFFSKLQPLIDEGLTGKNPDFMKYAPAFVIVAFILRGICHFLGNYCLAWVGSHVVASIRQQVFQHILSLPVKYHDQHSTGSMISKITFDAEQILEATSNAMLTLVQQGAFVTGLLIVMFYNSWQLSLIFLLITPLIAVIVTFVSKRFRQVSKNIQGAMGDVTSAAEQTFNAHKVVVTFGGKQREYARFAKINKHNRQQRMKMVATKAASVPFIQIIASFALAVVLYTASLDSMQQSLTPGIFTTVLTCMTMLLRPLKLLTTVNSDFQRGMAACVSIFAVLDEPTEPDLGDVSVTKAQGAIEFVDVSFSYLGEQKPAVEHLSFTAKPGEIVALVGRSGSGKSTITSLLLRFYNASAGKILIDGVAIEQYQLADIRQQFAYVSQQVVLFNDSIANNIAYGKPDASEAEILAAAKNAHVLEFANAMPNGIHTNIGENGGMLSGGQRQRIAIARALLCDAPFLILDEATSALDTESERYIQDALQLLQKNRTSIVIAHRLSTIEHADKILVMEQGRLIEQGDHRTLLAQNGSYAQLYQYQFGAA
jgi:ATP-binding cassette, subfamily B, bacterial MsbA